MTTKSLDLPDEEQIDSSSKSLKSSGTSEKETNEIDKSLFETMDDYIEG